MMRHGLPQRARSLSGAGSGPAPSRNGALPSGPERTDVWRRLRVQQLLSMAGRRSTAICYDYVKGLCTRADCRYTHDLTSIIHGLHQPAAVEICFDFSR